MSRLVLHKQTENRLSAVQDRPTQGLLITGPAGCGKMTLALRLAETILKAKPGSGHAHPFVHLIVQADNKAISIDAIRELDHFLSLKVPAETSFNRAVIIENAHVLTLEAQNALLKTLEEPPTGTIIILTASHEQSLLPTIRSRLQVMPLTKPDKASLNQYFSQLGYDDQAIAQAYSVTGGLVGLMQAMLGDEKHQLRQATDYARRLLSCSSYEKLLTVDELSKNRQLAADVCYILQQMAHLSLQSAAGPAEQRWQRVLEAAYEASESLNVNVQPKLIMMNLMLSL